MDIEKFFSKFYKGSKDLKLEAMYYFMQKYGNPEKKLKIIHVAGTNGKGSCVEMISNVLTSAKYKVGKFISPHLIKVNERICIGNTEISNAELEELITELMPEIEEYNKSHIHNISYFELEIIIAILYFYRKKCDFVVLETGLGGLHDSTNIVHPIVSVITSIGYDHMHLLGNTLQEIAVQKAGIIKENSNTVFVSQEKEINKIIEDTCKAKNNILHLINEQDITNYSYNYNYQKFDYKNYKDILVNLKGKKQVYNAATCIESIEILKNKGYKITEENIKNGLKTVVHKARFEKLHDNPTIIYDGAHNKSAIYNLKDTINMYYKESKKVFIISILKRKDYHGMLEELLSQYKDAIYIFTNGNDKEKYVQGEILADTAKNIVKNANVQVKEIEDAIEYTIKNYKGYTIFVIGSFYVYGNVVNKLKERM